MLGPVDDANAVKFVLDILASSSTDVSTRFALLYSVSRFFGSLSLSPFSTDGGTPRHPQPKQAMLEK
jgi:hypothetical protein